MQGLQFIVSLVSGLPGPRLLGRVWVWCGGVGRGEEVGGHAGLSLQLGMGMVTHGFQNLMSGGCKEWCLIHF